jgi:glycosyltransferase involved in cell wall biosynthesis
MTDMRTLRDRIRFAKMHGSLSSIRNSIVAKTAETASRVNLYQRATVEACRVPKAKTINSILVWINTYNRPDSLRELLSDIADTQENFSVSVVVFNDHSDKSYADVVASAKRRLNIEIFDMPERHGKKKYWKLCTYAMKTMTPAMQGYRYIVKLDDDLRLAPQFFRRCINLWSAIRDPRKVALNFRLDHRENKRGWTGTVPELESFGKWNIYLSQWVDMDFFVENRFFKELSHRILPISESRWRNNPNLSSGVGQQISERLYKKGWNMYLTAQSLVKHDHHESLMNPEERRVVTLQTKELEDTRYGLC